MANLREEERRGAEARQLLENKLLREAFATVEERIIARLARIDAPKKEVARLQMALAMGRKYQEYLKQIAFTGNLAEQDIKVIEEQQKGRRLWGVIP